MLDRKEAQDVTILPSTVSASSLEAMECKSMQWESLESYVRQHGGTRVISRILIANNGIAAVKCIRSLRKWAYSELGVETALTFVCMATPEDIAANAEYVRLADEVVQVPGGPNNYNYANVDLIVDLAERKQVDAVWAGWGHASENPQLPHRLSKTKRQIVFLGPGAKAMYDLGDKVGSTIIAQSANVPCIAWSGSHVRLDSDAIASGKPEIAPEVYLKACVSSPEEALEAAEKVGYPLMVKASEGGGGKGIRKVMKREDLAAALYQVQSEVVGSPVFLMKLFSGGRHIEVQVLADKHGQVITLNGRDCSIQRRHQKIIEEGPPIAAEPHIFTQMERAAAALAKAVGYEGVGTVEYLYRDEHFYFLEMNPRLQVSTLGALFLTLFALFYSLRALFIFSVLCSLHTKAHFSHWNVTLAGRAHRHRNDQRFQPSTSYASRWHGYPVASHSGRAFFLRRT
jgi:acetyl-CoA carboxylase/biotin carboxylase 1